MADRKPRVGIVAALAREVDSLVRGKRPTRVIAEGRRIAVYETDSWVAACGGIGREAAQASAEVLVEKYKVNTLMSCGLSGALIPQLKLPQTFIAGRVIDAASTREWSNPAGAVTLVSAASILGPAAKRELASKFSAQAVDMEAAAVAEVAEQAGIPFVALKSISDELDFPLPPLQRFVKADGSLAMGRLLVFLLFHPGQWPAVIALARNSRRASLALTQVLRHQIDKQFEAASALKSK
jgi:nucleoside phosphorylase